MKIEKERKIVKLMIELYYDKKLKHQFEDEKNDLIKYVNFRLDKCPFQDKKTFCSKCKIHCYQDAYKEKIKKSYAIQRSKNAFLSSGFII